MIHDTFLKENGSVLGLHRNNTSCRKKKIRNSGYSLFTSRKAYDQGNRIYSTMCFSLDIR